MTVNDIEDGHNIKYSTNHLNNNNFNDNDVMQYKPLLIDILNSINQNMKKKEYEKLYVALKKKHKMMAKKSHLFRAYKKLVYANQISINNRFEKLNRVKPMRGNPGVTVIATIMSDKPNNQPFTCKWDCSYCPKEPGQPRSYLSGEPCVARGNRNNFDPHLQFIERASTYFINGHIVDKIELLILGGTFHSYPTDYREWFIKMLIYSANTFYDVDKRDPKSLDEEIFINETARVRIIGITIETRPDCINNQTLLELRRLEVTRIQMGVQHTDDDVLSKNNRGHKLKHAIRGIQIAMNMGFKVDIHLMTNLPGSSAEKDKAMFHRVLSDPSCQGDQWKIYPTQVTPFTKIAEWYKNGSYVPYDSNEMFEVILDAKTKIWPWIRNNRIIRDFSSKDDLAGNIVPNMRQELHKELEKRGQKCHCIRCFEVGSDIQDIKNARLITRHIQNEIDKQYNTNHRFESESKDYFLSFESCSCNFYEFYRNHMITGCESFGGCPNRKKLYGFLRLRIVKVNNKKLPELHNQKVAFVRELHVYGKTTAVGEKDKDSSQHYSFGKKLLKEAEKIAYSEHCELLAIISGVGVRKYYEKFGYKLLSNAKYMCKVVENNTDKSNNIINIIILLFSLLMYYLYM